MFKNLKGKAKDTLFSHYLLYIFVCLISVFIGVEFIGSLTITKLDFNENIFRGTKGVFAYIINLSTSDTISTTLLNSIKSIVGSTNIANIILIVMSFLSSLGIWIFFKNIYQVLVRRIFLEGRTYKVVSLQTFLYLFNKKKWFKTSITMLRTSIQYLLWCFTIVGIAVKRYEYFLVSYIIAENPDCDFKTAIKLSCDMMNGHKWECFKLELSFIGWEILGFFTFGLSKVLYSNPYELGTKTEYFYILRKEAKSKKIDNIDILNDNYLYNKANKELLNETYDDVLYLLKNKATKLELTGYKKVLDILGIKVSNKKYEEQQLIESKKRVYTNILEQNQYPERLSSLPNRMKEKMLDNNYIRHYSIASLISMFFIFAIIGWLWEVSLHLITDGVFVNRGVMHGPWLPIYGWGGVLILTILNKFRDKPWLEFLSIVILCGLVEYFTSVYLEVFHNERWWNYSGFVLNLNGRICAEGLLVFAVGGMFAVYIVAPFLDNLLKKINSDVLLMIIVSLLSFFILDQLYSSKNPNTGKGITAQHVKIEEVIK